MKNYRSLFLMLITGLTISACSNPTQTNNTRIGTINSGDCMIKSIETRYPSFTVLQEIQYNPDNTISETKKYVNEMLERRNIMTYDGQKNVIKIDVYTPDTIATSYGIEWFADSAMISYFDKSGSELMLTHKEIMTFNTDGEVTESATFSSDSNNIWSRTGTAYLYAWEQNKLVGARNYVDESLNDSTVQNFDSPILTLAVNDRVYKVRQINPNFNLFYDAKFTYSEIKNPFRHVSIASLLPAATYNASVFCPTMTIKTYSTGEIISSSSTFEVNSQNYPVKEIITYVIDDNGTITKGQYERIYTYINCIE